MLSKLTRLHLFKLACRCLSTLIHANIDKQQMDKKLQGCSPACCEEFGKEKKKAFSHQIYCLISTNHVQVLLLDIGDNVLEDLPAVEGEVPAYCQSFVRFNFFFNFSSVYLYSRPKQIFWNHAAYLNIVFVEKSVSTNVTSLRITAHVNSRVDCNIICTSWSICLQP